LILKRASFVVDELHLTRLTVGSFFFQRGGPLGAEGSPPLLVEPFRSPFTLWGAIRRMAYPPVGPRSSPNWPFPPQFRVDPSFPSATVSRPCLGVVCSSLFLQAQFLCTRFFGASLIQGGLLRLALCLHDPCRALLRLSTTASIPRFHVPFSPMSPRTFFLPAPEYYSLDNRSNDR